jgi:hypothetical protein
MEQAVELIEELVGVLDAENPDITDEGIELVAVFVLCGLTSCGDLEPEHLSRADHEALDHFSKVWWRMNDVLPLDDPHREHWWRVVMNLLFKVEAEYYRYCRECN